MNLNEYSDTREAVDYPDEIIDPAVLVAIEADRQTLPRDRCPFYNRPHRAHPWMRQLDDHAWCEG